ncbi:hypothetical protein DL93DRAFT_1051911 [Clavulina sp. PMI_390]|nr:hypothetical protein DL93DRAFT_1051911 [Clavulina sp. PMI_390]
MSFFSFLLFTVTGGSFFRQLPLFIAPPLNQHYMCEQNPHHNRPSFPSHLVFFVFYFPGATYLSGLPTLLHGLLGTLKREVIHLAQSAYITYFLVQLGSYRLFLHISKRSTWGYVIMSSLLEADGDIDSRRR